ncbi:hypothetical protein RND81_13G133400 [Saponaria officinalis]|uniref:Uncharacterized protein n=1 Tax=Saponaria officinalis TaxID=3572 RepID=A0AAW1GXB5_SAPOF
MASSDKNGYEMGKKGFDVPSFEAADYKVAEVDVEVKKEAVVEVVNNEVVVGKDRWNGVNRDDLDPNEVFKTSESEGKYTITTSEATFTYSRPGYRGYRYCHLNEDGKYVMWDNLLGKEVVYNGSLDTDSEYNKRWCKRQKRDDTSSDSNEVSSHPRAKKPKSTST